MRSWNTFVVIGLSAVAVLGCVARPEPPAPTWSTEPPPWPAPRHAISYIEAAGLQPLPLDTRDNPHIVELVVRVDGKPVEVPAHLGVDRLRALQAPVHTHDASGDVWLEGPSERAVTLADVFTLWGVRFDEQCLGSACAQLEVWADSEPREEFLELELREVSAVEVSARHG